jgi:hypothetical protein
MACSCSYCCSGKEISITYSECVFCNLRYPAFNGHAPYRVLWPAPLYCIFCTNFVWHTSAWHTSHSQNHWSTICICLRVKCPFFLTDFKATWLFWTDLRKISNFLIVNPVAAQLHVTCARTDGQTWRSWYSLFAILRQHLKTFFNPPVPASRHIARTLT